MEHFREALQLINKWDQDNEQKKLRLDTVIKLCEVLEPLGEFETTLNLLEGVQKGSSVSEEPERYAKVHYWMGNNFGNMGRYDEARENLFRSLDLAQNSQNKETEGRAHNYLGQLDLAQGYLERGLDHAEAAIHCSLDTKNPIQIAWDFVFKAAIISDYKITSPWLEAIKEAKIWVERSKSNRVLALFHFLHSVGLYRLGDYEASLKAALEGLKLGEQIGEGIQTVFISGLAGVSALYAGKGELALELLNNGEVKGKEFGHPWALAYLRVCMAEVLLRLGKIEESKAPAKAALDFCQKLDLGITLISALHLNAEILSNQLPMEEKYIDDMMKKAEALVERSNSPLYKIRHLMATARISVKRNNITLAKESFSLARAIYKKIGLEDGTREFLSLEKEINL
jgi:tetratricopeptide (TPR) repeat protein